MEKPKLELRKDTGPTPEDIEAAAKDPTTSVYDILKDAHHPDRQKPLPSAKTKGRKKRDYWVGLSAINSILILPGIITGGSNLIVLVASFSAMVLFSIGFSWVIWAVISDY